MNTKKITIADVAEEAKVSKSTVSQYLNQRFEYMGEQTKERIAQAIKDLGYRPNIVARSLKQKTTTTIGVIVANISHEFSTQIVQSIEKYCNESNYHIIVCNAEDHPEKEQKYIEMLRAKQVDGIIVFPTSNNKELYQSLNLEDYPMVFIDRYVPEVKVSSIMLDNKKASQLAVEEFHRLGYERIGIITNSTKNNVTPRVERIEGFVQALESKNLEVNESYIKSVSLHEISKELVQMFSLEQPPEALLAGNDLALIEILQFTKKHQLQIPSDLAVIGIDDVSFASIYNPELTTIAQPTDEMGKKAAELLISQIQGEKPPFQQIYRFSPTLLSRSSCTGIKGGIL
ncbi:LacI family DNA-binding transcriptional regulator [Piscibacillus halophilus]|uniref:Transcriptional regulator, LacI family n=1 Tax=Piscibacillus halophilus TaxID=571933 RepID=A0A1H9HNX0_9BACI|nr:substrate-binding domain-containing protein [Piscibacillus halophilus]SEQ64024.1 transcriptional regulator, LacI family [Piscibacillus halophilus]